MLYLSPRSNQELEDYEKMVDRERVEKSEIETAGINKCNEIVKKMLAENVAIELICKVTGLSVKEIETLKENIRKR